MEKTWRPSRTLYNIIRIKRNNEGTPIACEFKMIYAADSVTMRKMYLYGLQWQLIILVKTQFLFRN